MEESLEHIDAASAKVTADISHVISYSAVLMLYPDESVAIRTQFAGLRSLLRTRLSCLGLQLGILRFEFSVACLKLPYLFK